jgi:hypothetical protein
MPVEGRNPAIARVYEYRRCKTLFIFSGIDFISKKIFITYFRNIENWDSYNPLKDLS